MRAWIYRCDEDRPTPIEPFFAGDERDPKTRYMYAREALRGREIWDEIHDMVVTSVYKRKKRRFMVFFKRHNELQKNLAIRSLPGAANVFEGDVLVAAMGPKHGIRNLSSTEERKAANDAIVK